ncbi:4-hydroxy-tetrahydrodipicolinate reductase [Salinivirga cyanobacteriivorans]|uniref:4-hydroxy-tetrahydrodipicolinate reductase n=1 Tax=Salinivirga cyanobacteriivorans TaxID=1307839 RepID=A0A0S2I4H9_9BACT|nr:4-hydroxy-tetrahydrodipicolinate reductase [Salinivirga cyanobacteriivorans]
MNVLLIGYGRMGKAVGEILRHRNHSIVKTIDEENASELDRLDPGSIDVAVEFTHPDAGFDNVMKCLRAGIPVITGTTGWNKQLPEAEKACREHDTAFLYAPNFSPGVNMLFAMNEKLAKLMNGQAQYEASIEETHHIHKKDKPSGTAVNLATQLVDHLDRYKNYTLDKKEKESLPVYAHREGEVFGDHSITYTSEVDTLMLSHHAKSRKGFALGAAMAAEYVYNRKGVFTMKDVLEIE